MNAASSTVRRTLFNVLFASVGYVGIRLIVAPVRIKILTSVLSKETYGALTLVMLTVSFVTLISSLGSLEYMIRKLPGRPRSFQLSVLRTIMTYFGLLAGAIGVIGVLGLAAWQPEKLGLTAMDYVAAGLILVLTVHLVQLVYFLMGRSEYAQSRLLMLFYGDAWFLPLLIFMWWIEITIHFMLWLWVVWLILSVVFSQVYVQTRALLRVRPSRVQLKEIVVFGVPLLPMIMGEWIFQMQDRYVLLAFTDLEAVANFTLCYNIAWIGVFTGAALVDVLVTEFYKMRNRVDSTDLAVLVAHQPLRQSFSMLLRYALLVCIPIFGALWFGYTPIVLLLSDPQFSDAAPLLRWVAPIPVLYSLMNISARTLIATDRGRVVGIGTLGAAAVHLVLSLLLVPQMAERGVALAGCIAYGLLAIYLGYRVRFGQWIDWATVRPLRLILFAGITLATFHFSFNSLPVPGFLALVIGGLISLASLFIVGLMPMADLRHLIESIQYSAAEDESAAD